MKEYYKRISVSTIPGDMQMKEDDQVEIQLNTKLITWVNSMNYTHPAFNYRITNTDHITLPAPAYGPGKETLMIAINIAYTI